MRRVLVDHARSRGYRNAGVAPSGSRWRGLVTRRNRHLDLVALDRALEGLAAVDVRKSRGVELRFFGGLSVEETAEVLHVSPDTVNATGGWQNSGCCELEGEAR